MDEAKFTISVNTDGRFSATLRTDKMEEVNTFIGTEALVVVKTLKKLQDDYLGTVPTPVNTPVQTPAQAPATKPVVATCENHKGFLEEGTIICDRDRKTKDGKVYMTKGTKIPVITCSKCNSIWEKREVQSGDRAGQAYFVRTTGNKTAGFKKAYLNEDGTEYIK